MTLNPTNSSIEIEAKFQGGQSEFEQILAWLSGKNGFESVRKAVVHRIHVYFDHGSRLKEIGCRLRCVIAPGDWFRYDFKADDSSGSTLEVSIEKEMPAPLPEVIDELLAQVSESEARHRLLDIRNAARITIVLSGAHQKAVIRSPHLDLEVSWDVLTSCESGDRISEVEVELLSGERKDFENCITQISIDSKLERIYGSKLERFLGAVGHAK